MKDIIVLEKGSEALRTMNINYNQQLEKENPLEVKKKPAQPKEDIAVKKSLEVNKGG